jgi:hypothetical protein
MRISRDASAMTLVIKCMNRPTECGSNEGVRNVERQNVEWQNVKWQNVKLQNVERQNVECQNVEHQNVECQNVEKIPKTYLTSFYGPNLTANRSC